jgi:hypothetical protein
VLFRSLLGPLKDALKRDDSSKGTPEDRKKNGMPIFLYGIIKCITTK